MLSLFTNVLVDDVLNCCFLEDSDLPFSLTNFLTLTKFCVSNNYFTFNHKYYLLCIGMSMGSPLGPVISCLYMDFFETKHFYDS